MLGAARTAFYAGQNRYTNPTTTWQTINNAVTSTAQSKFGSASMSIPTTTLSPDGIQSIGGDQTMFDFGTGDFTVEFYVRWNNSAFFLETGVMGLFQTDGFGLAIKYFTDTYIQIFKVDGGYTFEKGNFTFAANTWLYFCVQRSGTTINMWMNGTPLSLTGTGAGTHNFASRIAGPCVIGTVDPGFSGLINCYLDEVLITKGFAKYPTSGSISVPTQPFTVGQYTSQLMHMDGQNNGTVFTNAQT